MRLHVRVAGNREPTTVEGVDGTTDVQQLLDMVCAAAKLRPDEQARKLVHRRAIIREGTVADNGVEDGAWLVLLPPASRRETGCTAAPAADTGAPSRAAIRMATASEESIAKEDKDVQNVLQLLSKFFVRTSDEGNDEAGSGAAAEDAGLQQLQEMGFSENRARRALLLNSGTTAAMEWILQQDFDDASLDSPLSEPELAAIEKQRSAFMPSPQLVHQLVEMGFELGKVLLALRACNNREDRALAWLCAETETPHDISDSDRAICALGTMLSQSSSSLANRRMLQTLGAVAHGDYDSESVLDDPILAPFLRQLVHTLASSANAGGASAGAEADGQ